MNITEMHPPTNGGTLYVGRATSTRGRRYQFLIDRRGSVCGVDREEPLTDGLVSIGGHPVDLWLRVSPPKALVLAARRAVRKAVQS